MEGEWCLGIEKKKRKELGKWTVLILCEKCGNCEKKVVL